MQCEEVCEGQCPCNLSGLNAYRYSKFDIALAPKRSACESEHPLVAKECREEGGDIYSKKHDSSYTTGNFTNVY